MKDLQRKSIFGKYEWETSIMADFLQMRLSKIFYRQPHKKSGAALRVPLEQNPFYRMKQNFCRILGYWDIVPVS